MFFGCKIRDYHRNRLYEESPYFYENSPIWTFYSVLFLFARNSVGDLPKCSLQNAAR